MLICNGSGGWCADDSSARAEQLSRAASQPPPTTPRSAFRGDRDRDRMRRDLEQGSGDRAVKLSGLDLVRRYLVRGACALLRPPAHVHHVQSVSQSVSHHVVAPTCGVGVGSLYRCSTPRPISGITVGRCLSALGTGVSTGIRCFFVGLKQSVDPKVKGLMQRSRTKNVLSSALSA